MPELPINGDTGTAARPGGGASRTFCVPGDATATALPNAGTFSMAVTTAARP